jgi:hypothetical protein
MTRYLAEVHRMEKCFDGFEIRYVLHPDNHGVDHLALISSSTALTPLDVSVERLSKPSVKPAEPNQEAIRQDLMVTDEPEQEPAYDWMHLIKILREPATIGRQRQS